MKKRTRKTRLRPAGSTQTGVDLNQVRREARTALELAVVALAPTELVNRLAAVAGLLEVVTELPPASPPVLALMPGLLERAQDVLHDWHTWQKEHLEQRMARG